MNESVNSLCKNALPEGNESKLCKLVRERKSFTTKEFCEALGLRVELKKTKEMKPGDLVAGSKSQSVAEPGKEVQIKEAQNKAAQNKEVPNKEVRKEVPSKEMQSKEARKEVPSKEKAESWFAKNRVWVLIAALVVVVLAAVYRAKGLNK